MDLLADLGQPTMQPLCTTLEMLRTGRPLERPIVCLTFDDGMADNAELALPILQRHGFKATFFLATGHVDTEALLSNDIIRLLKHAIACGRLEPPASGVCRSLLTQPAFCKSTSALAYRAELAAFWQANQSHADPDGIRAMSMMSWDQARRLRDAGMEIGAHTVDHVILSRETDLERRRQIESSIQAVKANLNLDAVPFSYPNGQPDDFGDADLAVLEELNAPYAASTIPGWNDATTPRLALRRTCIGLHHSDRAFLAAVFGLLDQPAAGLERKSA
jgi:peptidoglycan/xylan/chitin deacetylase (PgdA/CDA1 family)